METAATLLTVVEYWCYAGLALAAVFLTVGLDRVEPNARVSFIFRPLLLPGVVILWPLVAWRWWQLETGRDAPLARHRPPRAWHRRFWIVFACAIPAILILGLIVRQDGPYERPAVLLEPPEASQ
ncbi:MAG: hypothetical protein AAFV19_11400 [Pseudomonadota bacterium]